MSEKKRAVEIVRDEKAPVVPISQTKADFLALLAAYKIKNPIKYAIKEASGEFAAKLAKIVAVIVAVVLVSAGVADAKMLSVGSRGNDVVNLQSFLISNGFPIPLIENGQASKGYFGTQTRDAVMMLQETTGVSMTGSIDSENYQSVKLGAVSSPDLMSPYFSFGGVRQWAYSSDTLKQASTTCSFLAPAATTTLVAATIRLSTIASTTVVEIGNDTTAYATTTLLATKNVTGATQDQVVVASTTYALADGVVNPNTYINFKVGGGATKGTYAPAGRCSVVFREI